MSGVLIEKETEILAIILGGAMQHKNTHTHVHTRKTLPNWQVVKARCRINDHTHTKEQTDTNTVKS